MKDSDRAKLKVGETVKVRVITGKVVTGKVVRRDGKIMISSDQIYYHFSAINEVLS